VNTKRDKPDEDDFAEQLLDLDEALASDTPGALDADADTAFPADDRLQSAKAFLRYPLNASWVGVQLLGRQF